MVHAKLRKVYLAGILPSRTSSEREVLHPTPDIEVLVVESPRKAVMMNGRLPVSKVIGRLDLAR